MKRLVIVLTFLGMLFTGGFADSIDYKKEAGIIKGKFDEALQTYKDAKNQDDIDKAKSLVQEAYFGHFENLEGGIRINISAKKSFAMEREFGNIRKAIVGKQSVEEVQKQIDILKKDIDDILPIIEGGHRLVAEVTQGGAGSQQAQNGNSNSLTQTNPWDGIQSQIDTELQHANDLYNKKDFTAVKDSLNKVKFDLYRNTNLQIAFRKYISQSFDRQIQQIIGNTILNIQSIDSSKFTQATKDIKDLIGTGVAKLPSDADSLAPVQAVEDEGPSINFAQVKDNIKKKMDTVLDTYKTGDIKGAIGQAQDIYFDEYEGSGMENKVGAMDVSLKTNTEAIFNEIVALMKSKASVEKIQNAQNRLQDQLQISVNKQSNSSNPLALFIYALTIILREGFEALIIVAAMVAVLVQSGNKDKLKIVYSSIIVAIMLSFVTAYLVSLIFSNAGQSREVLEGLTMLIAVVLLFYVGFWLLSKAESEKWMKYIKGSVGESLTSGDRKTLWWTVFLAVYREGAEVVLFYQALIFDAKTPLSLYGGVGGGFVLGVIILVIVYFVIKILAIKIPIKPFFKITSIIIFFMSFVFVGKGVMELVEGKLFIPTIIHGIPTVQWLGIYSYYESLIPQVIVLVLLATGLALLKRKKNK